MNTPASLSKQSNGFDILEAKLLSLALASIPLSAQMPFRLAPSHNRCIYQPARQSLQELFLIKLTNKLKIKYIYFLKIIYFLLAVLIFALYF